MLQLDRIDKRILEILQRDSSISNLDLADRVDLSPTPCLRRVKRLEESGVIRRQVSLLDKSMLGLNLTAYIGIAMDRHTPDRFDQFEEAVADMPEVLECAIVTGQQSDFLLKVVVKDMEHYERFLLGKLTKLEGVSGVHSSFVLRHLVEKTAYPV